MKALKRVYSKHWSIVFLIMGGAALALGLSTTHIFMTFESNIAAFAHPERFMMAGGGCEKLLTLFVQGFVLLAAYVVFKACEKELVERLLK